MTSKDNTVWPEEAVVEQQVFRDVIGRFASGVTVITTTAGGVAFGTTASAVSSLSMEPPMLLVCLNKSSETGRAVAEAGVFGVNILAEGQEELAYKFARKGGSKFEGVAVTACQTRGVPLLTDGLANLECQVSESVTGGTHTVLLARVAVAEGRDGAPLTYFRGRFGRQESTREEVAYAAMRDLVLTRQVPLNQPLELAALAKEARSGACPGRLRADEAGQRAAGQPDRRRAVPGGAADRGTGRRDVRCALRDRDRCGRRYHRPPERGGYRHAGGPRGQAGPDRGRGCARHRRIPGGQSRLP